MEEMGASEIVEQIEDMNIYQTGKVFNLKKLTDRLVEKFKVLCDSKVSFFQPPSSSACDLLEGSIEMVLCHYIVHYSCPSVFFHESIFHESHK